MISEGHRPEDVWKYTPKRLMAFVELAALRKRKETREQFTVMSTAHSVSFKNPEMIARKITG